MYLRNLKDDPNVDYYVQRELERCRVPIKRIDPSVDSELHCAVRGQLGEFEFIRGANHWEIRGHRVPTMAAKKIHDDPLGNDFYANRAKGGFITSYRVESEVGLRFLADMLREHGLLKEPAAA